MEGPYATIQEFAGHLTVSRSTVKRWLKQGLPHVRVGSIVRIPVAEARAWLAAQTLAGKMKRKRLPRALRVPIYDVSGPPTDERRARLPGEERGGPA
jgi:excisionase family DNA binding protein